MTCSTSCCCFSMRTGSSSVTASAETTISYLWSDTLILYLSLVFSFIGFFFCFFSLRIIKPIILNLFAVFGVFVFSLMYYFIWRVFLGIYITLFEALGELCVYLVTTDKSNTGFNLPIDTDILLIWVILLFYWFFFCSFRYFLPNWIGLRLSSSH